MSECTAVAPTLNERGVGRGRKGRGWGRLPSFAIEAGRGLEGMLQEYAKRCLPKMKWLTAAGRSTSARRAVTMHEEWWDSVKRCCTCAAKLHLAEPPSEPKGGSEGAREREQSGASTIHIAARPTRRVCPHDPQRDCSESAFAPLRPDKRPSQIVLRQEGRPEVISKHPALSHQRATSSCI